MIFPVPILMPMPSYPESQWSRFAPRVDTHHLESGLSDISRELKKMSAKMDKKDICINTDTDELLPVMKLVGPYVERESAAYEERFSRNYARISRIDEWKENRKKKKKIEERARKIEEYEAWNDALMEDALFNYNRQPKGSWWRGWVEKPYSEFLKESGYIEKESIEYVLMHQDNFDKFEGMNMRWMFTDGRVERISNKPFWISSSSEIIKLHQICEQLRGASIQIPSDLMQAVALIAKDMNLQSIEQEK